MKTLLFVLPILFLFMTSNVMAHPGRTASDGCHYCRTNCAKWGEVEGARHCHNEGTAAQPVAPVVTTKPYVAPATSKPTTPKPAIKSTISPAVTPTVTLTATPAQSPTSLPEVLSVSTEEPQATTKSQVEVQGVTETNPVGSLVGIGIFMLLSYKGLKLLAKKTAPSELK
jgi:hypothetical protein